MSKVGKSYKKTVELRKGTAVDIASETLICLTDPTSTEDFTVDIETFNLNSGLLNPTTNFIPIRVNGSYGDSPIRYDADQDLLISTSALQVPAGTIAVGEDLLIRNQGGFGVLANLVEPFDGVIPSRQVMPSDGSTEDRLRVQKLEPLEWRLLNPEDDVTVTINNQETIDVVRPNTDDGQILGQRFRGTSGKVTLNIFVAKDPDDDNTLTDQELIDLPRSEKIAIVDGILDVEEYWDFDNPSSPLDDWDEKFYKIPRGTYVDRKLILQWFIPSGIGSTTIRGGTGLGTFLPYFWSYGQDRSQEEFTIIDDTLTTIDNHWSSTKIQTELDLKLDDAPNDGDMYSRKSGAWIKDNALDTTYDNTLTGIPADNVQDAIDDLSLSKIDDAANVGGFAQVFRDEVNTTLNFRTIQSSNDSLEFAQNANDIDIIVNNDFQVIESLNTVLTNSNFATAPVTKFDQQLDLAGGTYQIVLSLEGAGSATNRSLDLQLEINGSPVDDIYSQEPKDTDDMFYITKVLTQSFTTGLHDFELLFGRSGGGGGSSVTVQNARLIVERKA